MKKIFSICILVFCVSCLFAQTLSSSVIVRSTVGTISLSDAAASSDNGGKLGVYDIFVGKEQSMINSSDLTFGDISENDITAYFRIYQFAKVKTNESIDLDIIASTLINNDVTATGNVESEKPTLSDFNDNNSVTGLTVTHAQDISNKNTVKLRLSYTDNTKTINEVDISTFKGTWPKFNAIVGDYTATLTLQYTVQ